MNVFGDAMTKRLRFLAAAPVLLASACTVGPNYHPKAAAELGVPGGYVNAPGAAASPQALTDWWQQFNDPVLNSLVEQSVAGNLDIAQAVARLRQLNPSLRVSNLKDVVGPYRHAEDLSRYAEGLRRAGLPE